MAGPLAARAAAAAPIDGCGPLVVGGGVDVVVLPAGALHLGDLGVGRAAASPALISAERLRACSSSSAS